MKLGSFGLGDFSLGSSGRGSFGLGDFGLNLPGLGDASLSNFEMPRQRLGDFGLGMAEDDDEPPMIGALRGIRRKPPY